MLKRRLLRLVPFAVLALLLLWWPAAAAHTPVTHRVDLDMTQFAFAPERLVINKGDQVVLTLTASDVVHGFHLDGHDVEIRIEPGISQQATFMADQAGKFRYRCSVSCGPLHPFMIGELVVVPNNPFWQASGLTLIALLGLLAYRWPVEEE